jgi:hypothetical protein
MNKLLLALMLASIALAGVAHATCPRQHANPTTRPVASPRVYICDGGCYTHHSSDNCAGLNRCSHGVTAVLVAEVEGMGRRPCKKCY